MKLEPYGLPYVLDDMAEEALAGKLPKASTVAAAALQVARSALEATKVHRGAEYAAADHGAAIRALTLVAQVSGLMKGESAGEAELNRDLDDPSFQADLARAGWELRRKATNGRA